MRKNTKLSSTSRGQAIGRRAWRTGALLLAAMMFAGVIAARAGAEEARDPAVLKAMERVFPALVRISVVMEMPDQGRIEKHSGAGSGAIISEDGYIITNHHVAGRACHLVVRMPDGEEIEAKLVGTDPLADIAIIKLNLDQRKKKTKLNVAKFGDSDKVRVGDTVFSLGSPMGVSQSVTKGIVSNTQLMMPDMMWFEEFKLDGENVGSLVRWIGHDAVIFGGNSGGPLVNASGEIIGINEVGLGSLGGAIPANLAQSVAQQLIKQGKVDRSWTGIEAQPRPKSLDLNRGALVADVVAGSPAAEAGLRAGDVLTEFDGAPVNVRIHEDLPQFNALVLSTPIGKTVTVKALRGQAEKTFTFKTCVRGLAGDRDREFKTWGITARSLTMLSALEHKRKDTQGALVTSVDRAGAAGAAEPILEAGDVIVSLDGRKVKDLEGFQSATDALLKGMEGEKPVLVVFERGVAKYTTVVKLNTPEPQPEGSARKPQLPFILQPVTPELGKLLGLGDKQGVRVAFVFPDSPPAKAGIASGDILISFDGNEIQCQRPEDVSRFQAQVRKYKIGTEVEVEFLREGQTRKAAFKLEAGDPEPDQIAKYKDKFFDFTLTDLTDKERTLKQIPATVHGVRVADIKAAGWASLARILGDDIILAIDGTPTPDVKTAEKMLKAVTAAKKPRILVELLRGIHTQFVEMEPDWSSAPSAAK